MSIAALGYVFLITLPANEKWLLVCLADYADDWGDSIFPALDTLEDKSGMSEATLKRTLKKLVERGAIERVAESTPVSPAFYRIIGVPEPKAFERQPQCPSVLRRAIVYAFDGTCEYCHGTGTKELGPDLRPWHVDRVRPGRRGGVYTPDNVTLACRTCNLKKKANSAPAGTRTLTDVLRDRRVQSEPSLVIPDAPPDERGEDPKLAPSEDPSVNPDPLLIRSTDPLLSRAGAAPQPYTHKPDDPDDCLAVITKLVHETFALIGPPRLGEHAEFFEVVKARCASLHIPYTSTVVGKAVESALVQRARARHAPAVS